MKVSIIGAGIGGLTLALALEQRGIVAEIFEATPSFRPVGAGLILAINAMQVYERLKIVSQLQARGRALEALHVTSPQLKPYSSSSFLPFEEQYGLSALTIHRAELHEALRNELKQTPIHLGKRLARCTPQPTGTLLEWEDGSTHHAEILIGADGIHSAVRAAIFPAVKERFAKQWCWRGLTFLDLADLPPTAIYEAWGKGCRFGIVPLQGQQVYWFACANVTAAVAKSLDQKGLEAIFESFHPIIGQLINKTTTDNLLLNPLSDLPNNPIWHQGDCCLLGDAAHATTPNMGQGANQAIESAWVLAEQLATQDNAPQAFATYQKIRQAKAQKVIQTSWQIGQLAQVEHPLLLGLRRALLALTPTSVSQQQLGKLYQLNY